MSGSDLTKNSRRRVLKACDRCRMKKSKCDGSVPCSRCNADNAICVFGHRNKPRDKVYPKGCGVCTFVKHRQADIAPRYVEMLRHNQAHLVAGLQETYRRLLAANLWPGAALQETNGHPHTHDILARLDLLESKQYGSNDSKIFEGDCGKLQQRLLAQSASCTPRRISLSSDSNHSHSNGNGSSSSSDATVLTHDSSKQIPNSDSEAMWSLPAKQTPALPPPLYNSMESSLLDAKPSDRRDWLTQTEFFGNFDMLWWQDPGLGHAAAEMLSSYDGTQAPPLHSTVQSHCDDWSGLESSLPYDASPILSSIPINGRASVPHNQERLLNETWLDLGQLH